MVNIIKSGIGNIGSITRLLDDLEYDYNIVEKPEDFSNSNKIILPGVGNFDFFISSLKEKNLYTLIKDNVLSKNYSILGICVGMQSLFEGSEEGKEKGFGFLKGNCKKFIPKRKLKVPHLGWNKINIVKNSILFDNIENLLFYFAHSFYVESNSEYEISSSCYIIDFCSSLNLNNIYGVQFHPEKSYTQGKAVIKNFIDLC
tara:strand:- start:78 stop:680 length:603 start_codon:yes stop_codon:yes gene_type:complete